jgi:hypothetical protein
MIHAADVLNHSRSIIFPTKPNLYAVTTAKNRRWSTSKSGVNVRVVRNDRYFIIPENGKTKNPEIATRLAVLTREIDRQIARIQRDENTELVERVYLYYDGYT